MDEQMQMNPDLLSNLLLGIIHIILSFVPLRDAIGTCLLSKHWRYIWTGLPNLVFDYKCANPLPKVTEFDEETEFDDEAEFDVKGIICFVNQALLLHKGPIHKFHLWVPPMEDYQFVDQWLLFLSRNDIRILELQYEVYTDNWIEVPSSLYFCQNLTHLELDASSIRLPPPSFKGFLFLRSLDIRTFDEDSSNIESIVSYCPLLENLTVDIVTYLSLDMTIRAPNLKYFCMKFFCDHLSLCTPLLEELIGYSPLIKSIGESSVFCHLRVVKLWYSAEVLPTIIHLIKAASNLRQLEISCYSHCGDYYPIHDSVSFWNTEIAPHLTYHSLKVIKMDSFGGHFDEMKLAEFLLARSSVLEKMIYMQKKSIPDKMLLKIRAQLLKFHRASANAKIVVRREMI